MAGSRRILQLHNLHAGPGGGAVEVLDNERDLLVEAGYVVDRFVIGAEEAQQIGPLRAGARAVWNGQAHAQVSRAIEAQRPDLVHLHTPFPLMSPSVIAAVARAGIPMVGTNHSHRYVCPAGTLFRDGEVCTRCVGLTWKWPAVVHSCYHDSAAASAALSLSLGLHKTRGTFRHGFARMIALTEFSRGLLVQDGFDPRQVVVKPNSVAAPTVGPAGRRPGRFVFAGRLVPEKGIGTLLEAWSRVGNPEVELVVLGDGPLRELVEDRMAPDPRVRYAGWASTGEVAQAMATAEATIIPSLWHEGGFPLVGMQSLSVGTPVITSDLPNLTDLPTGCGTSFPTGDAESLATVLDGYTATEAARSAAAAAYHTRYSQDSNSRALRAIYDEALASDA